MQVKKQQLEPNVEQETGFKLGKEYIKAKYCHPAYLTYMLSTSYEILDWMTHKLESRLLGEISITTTLIPTCSSSSLAFPMMHTGYKLHKYGDNYSLDIFLSQF